MAEREFEEREFFAGEITGSITAIGGSTFGVITGIKLAAQGDVKSVVQVYLTDDEETDPLDSEKFLPDLTVQKNGHIEWSGWKPIREGQVLAARVKSGPNVNCFVDGAEMQEIVT